MKRKFAVSLILFIFSLLFSVKQVEASAPYNTFTLNRFNEYILTQDAYEPILSVSGVSDVIFSNPEDLFIDQNDTIYVADTGNHRIVLLDKNFNLVTIIGEDDLKDPTGIYVRDQLIYVSDYEKQAIMVFDLDGNIVKEMTAPTSPIFSVNGFQFRPKKIAVDARGIMYVVNESSTNGILKINEYGKFLEYFAPNVTKGTFKDKLVQIFYGSNENAKVIKKVPVAPYNVMLDDQTGFIYTVSQYKTNNGFGDAIKKLNIGGRNFYPSEMANVDNFVDIWPGEVGNSYAISADGTIYEYDIDGNLLFKFGGLGYNNDRIGLFSSASSIAVNSDGQIFALDNNRGNLQIFNPTIFTEDVHHALDLYNQGKYSESLEVWQEVLRYNSMFDLAHRGLGLAHFNNQDYHKALNEFKIANYKHGVSEAYSEIRNDWLIDNVKYFFLAWFLISLALLVKHIVEKRMNKKFKLFNFKITNKRLLEFKYLFRYVKNPSDAAYYVKREKRVTYLTAIIFLLVLAAVSISRIMFTGFIFNGFVVERTNLIKEVFKLIIPFMAFVISNYLISSLMEGEGTFKDIFIGSAGALLPALFILPINIVLSNVLTFNEAFIIQFLYAVMILWCVGLLFANIKETHNFNVKEMFINIFLTIFIMIILIIVIMIVSITFYQLYSFVMGIFKEAILNV